MIDKIDEFIQSLTVLNVKQYAKNYFNIIFTDDELTKILPFIKAYWKDYLNENTRQLFINQLIVASNEKTANKVITLVNRLLRLYNIIDI